MLTDRQAMAMTYQAATITVTSPNHGLDVLLYGTEQESM